MMKVRVTIDGEVVNTISLGLWCATMLDAGHEGEEVAAMIEQFEEGKTVKDGGGASPVFEYDLLPPRPALR